MIHVADINKVTGYVRGGCSPVGMKKQYKTVFDESVLAQEKCMFPAGASAPRCAVLRRISSVPPAPPRQRSSSEPGRKVRLWDKDGWKILRKIYSSHKSYLKEKRWRNCTKLLKVFGAWKHKGEFAATPFAKPLFCRKLYVAQGRSPHRTGPAPCRNASTETAEEEIHEKTLPGRMERNNIRACQGHRAASCKAWEQNTQNKGCGAGVPLPFVCQKWKERVWIMVRKVAVIMGSDSDWPVVKGLCPAQSAGHPL